MRDDIHKNAPVNKQWKSFIRVCSRDADWEKNGLKKAFEAIKNGWKELTPNFINQAKKIFSNTQLSFFDPKQELINLKDQHFLYSVRTAFLEHAIILCSKNTNTELIIEKAVTNTLNENIDNNLRNVEA